MGEPIEGYGTGPLSPTSPISSPPLRPQDKGVQDYIGELQLQAEEQIKRMQDQERLSNARLREQDILITELQEKLDIVEDELKERKKELGELRTKDARYSSLCYLPNIELSRLFAAWRKKSKPENSS
jgi:hypothetical protein